MGSAVPSHVSLLILLTTQTEFGHGGGIQIIQCKGHIIINQSIVGLDIPCWTPPELKAEMKTRKITLREKLKHGLFSCLSAPNSPPLSHSPGKNKSPDSDEPRIKDKPSLGILPVRHPEVDRWSRAVEAAQLRDHLPRPGDALSPWAYAEETPYVCTLEPFPSNRVTLFLRSTLSGADLARKLRSDFFAEMKLSIKDIVKKDFDSNYPIGPSTTILHSGDDSPILIVETAPGEHMYENTLMLTSGNYTEAQQTLEYLDSIFPRGFSCIIAHDVMVMSMETVMGTMKLIRRTGVEKAQLSAENMTTIFELEAEGAPRVGCGKPLGITPKVVARCVLGYRDGSVWPSVGPTIQTLMVRTDYQGSGLVQELFNAVEEWFMESWSLDTRKGNRIFKATYLRDFLVDRVPKAKGVSSGLNYGLTDKMFFYEVMHFVCNNPYPADPRVKLGGAIPESHAIRYYPPTGAPVSFPTVYLTQPSATKGWRSCDNCRVSESSPGTLYVCANCKLPRYWRAHYCSRACQVKDWPVHKLWCGKTYKQVCDENNILEKNMKAASRMSALRQGLDSDTV